MKKFIYTFFVSLILLFSGLNSVTQAQSIGNSDPIPSMATGELVINEFMADNETTILDPDGENEDWIELYNNGNAPINLSGYYMSDKIDEPNKWVFPDITIEAHGYLIIWADEDVDQTGVHADFKLSKSGEAIILSDVSLNMLDQIEFGAQSTDTTYGRFPNGTGDFIQMLPTFNAENLNQLVGIQNIATQLACYPNPFINDVYFVSDGSKNFSQALVYNSLGQMVYSENLQEGTNRIELNNLEKGVYFLRLQTNDGNILTQQIVKQ